MRKQIRLIAADDHGVVGRGLIALMSTQSGIDLIAMAGGGHEAVELTLQHQPDVLLLDLIMPDMDGMHTLRTVRSDAPAVKVVILTSVETESTVHEAMRAGASAYLLKDTEPDDLIRAILEVMNGKRIMSPRISQLLMNSFGKKGDRSLHDMLSQREMQVLLLLGEGLSNAAIADRLAIGEKTVKSHVSSVLAKLYLTDRTQAAAYAWRHKLLD